MARIAILLANGFETIEALTPADVLRRGDQDVALVTINETPLVTTAQSVSIVCDATLADYDVTNCDLLVLPGGMPGTKNLRSDERVCTLVREFMAHRKLGAICAAPSILAELGLLEGRTATCYPGFEDNFPESVRPAELGVYKDKKIVTASGPGFALPFGLALLRFVAGEEAERRVADGMLLNR